MNQESVFMVSKKKKKKKKNINIKKMYIIYNKNNKKKQFQNKQINKIQITLAACLVNYKKFLN